MANSAWLGLQKKDAFSVSCIRLFQTRERLWQASTAVLQVWDGLVWTASKERWDLLGAGDHPIFTELGGGAWQVLPGQRASMWRVIADPPPGGHGNPDCSDPIPASVPNIMPICSGYATSREVGDKTGYTTHYARMGELTPAEPMLAFDGKLDTFWADVAGDRAWLGLDFSSQVSDVQCIRVAFPGIVSLQPRSGELQGWNGNTWRLQARWVFELEFHTDLACRRAPVAGEPISSAEDAELGDDYSGHRNPHKAFDHVPGRCRCWDHGMGRSRVRQRRSPGGDTWNRRPIPPATMWRIAYGERSGTVCLGQEERGWHRSWGVSEVEFYADDGCSMKLPGPDEGVDVVASGTREAGIAPLSGTGPHLAFDGLTATTWTAQCGAGARANEDPGAARATVVEAQ
eukprot:Skav200076  [mRNA]  locus=scaffold838:560247:568512:- [translate_table: standard]